MPLLVRATPGALKATDPGGRKGEGQGVSGGRARVRLAVPVPASARHGWPVFVVHLSASSHPLPRLPRPPCPCWSGPRGARCSSPIWGAERWKGKGDRGGARVEGQGVRGVGQGCGARVRLAASVSSSAARSSLDPVALPCCGPARFSRASCRDLQDRVRPHGPVWCCSSRSGAQISACGMENQPPGVAAVGPLSH